MTAVTLPTGLVRMFVASCLPAVSAHQHLQVCTPPEAAARYISSLALSELELQAITFHVWALECNILEQIWTKCQSQLHP